MRNVMLVYEPQKTHTLHESVHWACTLDETVHWCKINGNGMYYGVCT